IDALPLRNGRNRKHLRRPQYLPEALILAEIKSLAAAIVDSWNDHWTAVGSSKFVANKRRNAARIDIAFVIKEISRIKRGVANKCESAAMHLITARFCQHIREPSGAVPDFGRHRSRARLHFLYAIHVEIGKGSAAQLRVGRIRP